MDETETRRRLARTIDEEVDGFKQALDRDIRMFPIRMAAILIIETNRKLIEDTLMDCVSKGVFGRNQEEAVTAAVMAELHTGPMCDPIDDETWEDIECWLDAYLSQMRVYQEDEE